jgi:hypothetical protein
LNNAGLNQILTRDISYSMNLKSRFLHIKGGVVIVCGKFVQIVVSGYYIYLNT